MNNLVRGVCPEKKIAITIADATEAAKTLEQRHLSGPTAALALGQACAASALISTDLSAAQERISLQISCDGPLGGLLVDTGFDGAIRGYTNTKILNQFDDAPDLAAALGARASCQIIRSNKHSLIGSGIVYAEPADIRVCLARYYNESLQRPAGVALHAALESYHIKSACGLVAEKMPDATSADFVPVLEAFESGAVDAGLREGLTPESFAEVLGLPGLTWGAPKPLTFGCPCSQGRAESSIAAMATDELKSIVMAEEPQEIYCHFCGAHYIVSLESIYQILNERAEEN